MLLNVTVFIISIQRFHIAICTAHSDFSLYYVHSKWPYGPCAFNKFAMICYDISADETGVVGCTVASAGRDESAQCDESYRSSVKLMLSLTISRDSLERRVRVVSINLFAQPTVASQLSDSSPGLPATRPTAVLSAELACHPMHAVK